MMNSSVLIVDDEKTFTDSFVEALKNSHARVEHCYTFQDALTLLNENEYNVCVFDIFLPDGSGLELVKRTMEMLNAPEVILITASNLNSDFMEQNLKEFIFDYLQKPLDLEHALKRVKNAAEKQLLETSRKFQAEIEANKIRIVGNSPSIRNICNLITQLADVPSPVLITGETGTGKELVARAIHFQSERSSAPFVTVNCSAIPEELFESEFFGFERGAFTGAQTSKKGLFELADGGTLFLDEIGEMSVNFQSKLLRVLESGEYRRIGGSGIRYSTARIIAATNRNLLKEIKSPGKFREDLYYRISVVQVHLPALRDRREDIPLLTRYLWEKLSRQLKRKVDFPGEDWLRKLQARNWPGNIRELANEIERVLIFGKVNNESFQNDSMSAFSEFSDTEQQIAPLEIVIRQYIENVYERCNRNKSKNLIVYIKAETSVCKKLNQLN